MNVLHGSFELTSPRVGSHWQPSLTRRTQETPVGGLWDSQHLFSPFEWVMNVILPVVQNTLHPRTIINPPSINTNLILESEK